MKAGRCLTMTQSVDSLRSQPWFAPGNMRAFVVLLSIGRAGQGECKGVPSGSPTGRSGRNHPEGNQ